MGFLDASGVTTLVIKLKERFAPLTNGMISTNILPSASTLADGIVQLSSSTTSTSSTQAATPYAVNAAWEKSMYGTSSTGATTAAKTATCSNYSLVTGQIVTVQFSNANTYVGGALSLNVNSKGAKTIYKNGSATSASNTLLWDSGDVLQFVYDGSYYRFVSQSKPSIKYGSVTAASGFTVSEPNIKQSGNVVFVKFYVSKSTNIGTSAVDIATISGVTLPPSNIRFACSSGVHAYDAYYAAYAYCGTDGKIQVTLSQGASQAVVVCLTYIAEI